MVAALFYPSHNNPPPASVECVSLSVATHKLWLWISSDHNPQFHPGYGPDVDRRIHFWYKFFCRKHTHTHTHKGKIWWSQRCLLLFCWGCRMHGKHSSTVKTLWLLSFSLAASKIPGKQQLCKKVLHDKHERRELWQKIKRLKMDSEHLLLQFPLVKELSLV